MQAGHHTEKKDTISNSLIAKLWGNEQKTGL